MDDEEYEPEPQIGSAVVLTDHAIPWRELPKKFPIGFHFYKEDKPVTHEKFIAEMANHRPKATDEANILTKGFAYNTAHREVITEIFEEFRKARSSWPEFNSAHEGYAVLLEEVEELWDHVKTNQRKRDLPAMRKEAIQVAAMAMQFIVDICNEERGRK